jgi:S1-C subfamily serine protease
MEKMNLNELRSGVCFIEVEIPNPVDIQGQGCFTGSGFVISDLQSKRKLVATCSHVAPLSSRSIALEFNNGFRTKGKVVYEDHCHDLSLIEFEDANDQLDHIQYQFENNVSDFEQLTLIGGNEGYKSYVANGIVADNHILFDERNTIGIQTSIPSAGGTSGSPIFNEAGKIVGMHVSATERCGFEMKIEVILDSLDRFLKGKSKFESGITFAYENKFKFMDAGLISREDEESFFSKTSKLIVVKDVDVFYDSFNYLMPGDVILKINDCSIHNAFQAEKVMNDSQGLVCKILIKRSGVLFEKTIKLKNSIHETTSSILLWENATFQDTNITTRRYYSIKEQGVLMSKCNYGSPFSLVGVGSSKVYGGKGTLITHLNGIRVENLNEFKNVLRESQRSSVSLHYYDYISNYPQKFIICDVQYDQFNEMYLLNLKLEEIAA